jgi:peptide/nickel transport system substrate-binding protein
MLANVLAGSVDLVYQSLSLDGAKVIQQQWAQNNGGTVLLRPTNLEHILPEFRPEFAKPADILDVRMRRALAHGLNKEDVADAVGVPRELVADSVALPGTPEGDAVAKGLARYPYDPARASALLQEMGWQRGADGMLTRNDQPLQIEMRAGTTEGPALFTVAQQGYKQIGIDLVSVAVAGATDPQAEAQFSAISISSIPVTPLISWSNRWHSRQISGPANRYAGTNLEGYSSAVTDQAIVNLERALRRDDQLRYWTDVWRQISDDVGVIPVHFIPQPSVARRGVTGWVTPNLLGEPAYAPWTWDIS